ncbi:MAG: hypothetical protein WDM84_01515 [Bauldia sp.]
MDDRVPRPRAGEGAGARRRASGGDHHPASGSVRRRANRPEGGRTRADFIAAARRAARAVADEAASIQASAVADGPAETNETGERKPGAFARISQAIRSRKRPLLLAAAAIVLAIGGMQLYGKFGQLPAGSATVAAAKAQAPVVVMADAPKTVRQILDVTNSTQPAPAAAAQALIPPSANPSAQITFAKPDVAVGRFTGASPAPAANSFAAAPAPDAAPTDTASADTASADAAPVVLTSAGTAPAAAPATTAASIPASARRRSLPPPTRAIPAPSSRSPPAMPTARG